MPRPFDYTFLKFNDNGFVRERRNGCRGVLKIIDGGIAVRPRRVHGAKRRVVAEHALLRLGAVIEDERSCNADPFVALHGAEFYFGVRGDLLCYALAFAARAAGLLRRWQDSTFRRFLKIHRRDSWCFLLGIFLYYTTRAA